MNWITEHFRLTFFLRAPIDRAGADKYWGAFGGGDVQNVAESRVGPYPTLEFQRSIAHDQGSFVLRVEGPRVDLIAQGELNNPFSPPFLGEYVKTKQVLENWIATIPEAFPQPHQVWRVALGGVFLQNSPDRIAGYHKVKEFVPDLKIDPEKCSDLFYRINYPRVNRDGSVKLNVLTEWTVAAFSTGMVSATNHLGQAFSVPPVVTFYPRVGVDINTVDSTPLPEGTDLQELVASLLGIAEDILEKGLNHD